MTVASSVPRNLQILSGCVPVRFVEFQELSYLTFNVRIEKVGYIFLGVGRMFTFMFLEALCLSLLLLYKQCGFKITVLVRTSRIWYKRQKICS